MIFYRYRKPLAGLTPPYLCVSAGPELGFPTPYVGVFLVSTNLR